MTRLANISWADTEVGRGPTGTAIRTGCVQMSQTFLVDPALVPWGEAATQCGYLTGITATLLVLIFDLTVLPAIVRRMFRGKMR